MSFFLLLVPRTAKTANESNSVDRKTSLQTPTSEMAGATPMRHHETMTRKRTEFVRTKLLENTETSSVRGNVNQIELTLSVIRKKVFVHLFHLFSLFVIPCFPRLLPISPSHDPFFGRVFAVRAFRSGTCQRSWWHPDEKIVFTGWQSWWKSIPSVQFSFG